MQVSLGGTRTTAALVASLLLAGLFAGCLGGKDDTQNEVEVPEGHGLVTLWMARPANAAEYQVQVLNAVPRFLAFTAADNETTQRLGSNAYIDVAKGWTHKEGGWPDGEWPQSARKNWLHDYDIWYQAAVPVGNYSQIRIEVIDQNIIMYNSQPRLYIGTAQETSGHPRLTFKPGAEAGGFQVQEGEELVLNFQTLLTLEGRGRVLIQ
jgi:hypothetical protein